MNDCLHDVQRKPRNRGKMPKSESWAGEERKTLSRLPVTAFSTARWDTSIPWKSHISNTPPQSTKELKEKT